MKRIKPKLASWKRRISRLKDDDGDVISIASTASPKPPDKEAAANAKKDYNDAVLVEISLNWTQEEERIVEAFCLEKNEETLSPASSVSYFDEPPAILPCNSLRNQTGDSELLLASFDPEPFILREYSTSSMREITVDISKLEKDIETNIELLKSVVKKNLDQYLSAFTILQEINAMSLETDALTNLECALIGTMS